jgi:hypothetical protein
MDPAFSLPICTNTNEVLIGHLIEEKLWGRVRTKAPARTRTEQRFLSDQWT